MHGDETRQKCDVGRTVTWVVADGFCRVEVKEEDARASMLVGPVAGRHSSAGFTRTPSQGARNARSQTRRSTQGAALGASRFRQPGRCIRNREQEYGKSILEPTRSCGYLHSVLIRKHLNSLDCWNRISPAALMRNVIFIFNYVAQRVAWSYGTA